MSGGRRTCPRPHALRTRHVNRRRIGRQPSRLSTARGLWSTSLWAFDAVAPAVVILSKSSASAMRRRSVSKRKPAKRAVCALPSSRAQLR